MKGGTECLPLRGFNAMIPGLRVKGGEKRDLIRDFRGILAMNIPESSTLRQHINYLYVDTAERCESG